MANKGKPTLLNNPYPYADTR